MFDLTGQKFGRLTVQEFAGRKGSNYYWNCTCDCGNNTKTQGGALRNGSAKSCGCYNKEQSSKAHTVHGQAKDGVKTKEYSCWQRMKDRCYNINDKSYKNYGGRGIQVCERWHKFESFFEDMGRCPKGRSLDRKDNDGDYCKANCRWATNEEQYNNKRTNIWKEYEGKNKTIAQWGRSLGISDNTLWCRLNRYGWSIERTLTTEVREVSNVRTLVY